MPTATGAETWRAVRALLRPRIGLAVLALLVVTAATAAGIIIAPVLGHLIDLVTDQRPSSALTWPIVLLAVLAAVQAVATAYGLMLVARVSEGMLATLRERFVARVLRLPLERVEAAGSGDLTSRVTNDVSVVAEGAREALPALARSGLAILLTLGGLAVLDWRFLLAALLAAPIQWWTVRWYRRDAVPLYRRQRIAEGERQQQLIDTVGGADTVRAFRLGDDHLERVRGRSRAAVDLILEGSRLSTRFFGRLNVAEYVGLTAVLVVGFFLVRAETVTIGTAAAAALYFHNLFTPINTALSLVDEAQKATASLARLVGVADLADPDEPAAADGPLGAGAGATGFGEEADGSVRLDGVRHAYVEGHDVLRDVTLTVPASTTVALVGASGAGKTTLAKLIAGIHRPTAGAVVVGGADPAASAPGAGTPRSVVLVTQEVHVFAGPLADDLRLASPDADDAALLTALETVGARGWVEGLPEGLATVVGDGGHRLTATQSQQLALARLVLADPPVAILDEATAEAGSAGARVLETAAAGALAGRTAIVVAHRLTQAAIADQVVLLDAGQIAETGTHDDLSAADGPYAALWTAWSDTRVRPSPHQ
ncbi:ABC transporter ATP-binding protein [Frankia sp. CN7]|uniref:ABC transporter ATP-binding protein n=1 Tax=Frankia nepalensis TaxID=1836974 RepID=A0A937RH41_9ACTN|nr:ABC transporter ATP-binding protein [Frankia nepalensis]MBL7630012.1 ABC transporter ATP-binding protein [Frankia nepalensis]